MKTFEDDIKEIDKFWEEVGDNECDEKELEKFLNNSYYGKDQEEGLN